MRVAHDQPEEWLLIEWPKGEAEPTKYWLSTLAEDIAFPVLVDFAKLRWRIERDYQDLKQEVGLGHFEGRGWRGFHHHATLCIAAYGFLISERETIPPSRPRRALRLAELAIPQANTLRRATTAPGTPYSKLHRDHAPPPHRRSCQRPAAMPLLRGPAGTTIDAKKFVTQ